jgi:hypothetical protein
VNRDIKNLFTDYDGANQRVTRPPMCERGGAWSPTLWAIATHQLSAGKFSVCGPGDFQHLQVDAGNAVNGSPGKQNHLPAWSPDLARAVAHDERRNPRSS